MLDLSDIFFCFEFTPIFLVPHKSLRFSSLGSPPGRFHLT
jgi:hypothetical protein